MATYAKGTKSQAMCDRCGFQVPYLSLRREWTNLLVCGDCWESKHPQLEPRVASDPQVLRDARPDSDQEVAKIRVKGQSVSVEVTSVKTSTNTLGWGLGGWGGNGGGWGR